MQGIPQSSIVQAPVADNRQTWKLVFKILYFANLLTIIGFLIIAISDSRAEIDAGNTSVLSVLFFAAISRVIPFWTSLLALNIWGIFLHRNNRIPFLMISVVLAIFIALAIVIVIQFATFGV